MKPPHKNTGNFWSKLVEPHASLQDEESKINSQILSLLLVVLLPVATAFLGFLYFRYRLADPYLATDFRIFGSLIGTLWVFYFLNRLGYYKLSIFAILITGEIILVLESVLDHDPDDMVFLLLPMTFAAVLIPRKPLFIIGLCYISSPVILLPFLLEQEQNRVIKFVIPILAIGIILNFIARAHRDHLEELRKKQLIESELRYSLSIDAVNDGIWDWNFETNRVFYSPRWTEMIGYGQNEISDSPHEWLSRIHPDDLDHIANKLRHFVNDGLREAIDLEFRFRHKNGEYLWVLSRGRAIRNESGSITRVLGSHSDITLRKRAEERLVYDALHDSLTGLANRTLLAERLNQVIKRARKDPDYLYAILFFDLDNFKNINDSLGHDAGDEILKLFTRRVQAIVFDVDTLSRLGGDEFVLLLESLDSPQRPVEIINRIRHALDEPFQVKTRNIHLTASVGVVIGSRDYSSSEEVMRDADIAMYQAKSLGKDTFEIFNVSMREKIMKHLNLERDLRHAVHHKEFTLEYQPIIDLRTTRLLAFEALVRWSHPELGIVFPDEFIQMAEKTGLIIPIGEWVFRNACEQMKKWESIHPSVESLDININVSGKQLNHHKFYETVAEIIDTTGFDPERVNLEITETVILEDNPETLSTLTNLVKMGIKLHLDDFGKGQSYLAYLQKYPLSDIKIDRSFVANLPNSREQGLIRGIIQLAKALEITTIAEGIESKDQETILKSLECDGGQGFGISMPLSAVAVEHLLRGQSGSDSYYFPVKNIDE